MKKILVAIVALAVVVIMAIVMRPTLRKTTSEQAGSNKPTPVSRPTPVKSEQPSPPLPPSTPAVAQTTVPSFEFDRPCEPAWARMQRLRIVEELKELLSKMSLEEQEAFLVALYDAQENLAMVDAPATDVFIAFYSDLERIFGRQRAIAMRKAHAFATMLGVVETRALRTGREFISDEAWFESHNIRHDCTPRHAAAQ